MLALGDVQRLSISLNHIWSEKEIQDRMENLYQHRPKSLSDKIMHRRSKVFCGLLSHRGFMWSLYRGFNWVTGPLTSLTLFF